MAVLLHYLYLVSFMWMLMEGVVLYVVLVKVFVQKSKKKYFILFTVLSYGKTNADCFLMKLSLPKYRSGLPLLYMGLTIPLGFLLRDEPDYGFEEAYV